MSLRTWLGLGTRRLHLTYPNPTLTLALALALALALTRFAEIVAADLVAKEKKFGFELDDEDKETFEVMLRNKYCGKEGLSAGWGLPGGPCREANGCDSANGGGKMYAGAGCSERKDKKKKK